MMMFSTLVPVLIAVVIGFLMYFKGEVEWSSYLSCVILDYVIPDNYPNSNNDIIKLRNMIKSGNEHTDQGPSSINYIDTSYIPEYNNAQNDTLMLRIYNYDTTNSNKLKKVLIFYFPGAWIVGSVEMVHGICSHFAAATNFIVVNVQYRLAPEYPYPHAFYDAYSSLQWVKKNIHFYGGDMEYIFISGNIA